MKEITSVNEAIRILSRYPKKIKHTTPRSSSRYIRLMKFIRSKEGILASELASMMNIKPASLSEMLSNLESDDLIRREKDQNDKRRHCFYLTDKGHEHLFRHKHDQYDIFKDILSKEEEALFIDLTNKLIHSLTNE
ncbi:MarR family winged helix-turn-helix transcriptional regulator [Acidaminobacter sp. JC074]|uniref:MarR family winged helix-turn-helix transcriptional regulator n=1 Tax=Acidaminobacter sp. JC074 TaxID=2530199 RepID=UPI001F10597B|nr:MarR family transcriptional regulator [Acidaminobacter sp. JC074]